MPSLVKTARCVWLLLAVSISYSPATGTSDDTRLAARALDEFGRVCEPEGMRLWGKSLCGPMVLVDPSTRAAFANQQDPEGKFQKAGTIYTGVFPNRFTPANTAIDWNGQQWATVMLPLPVDPFARLSLVSHESFHRVQPALGLSGSDAASAHLESVAGRLWLRMELRALAAALRLDDEAGRRSATDAMLFRLNRHRLCPGSEAAEAAMEKQEGLAEYTGVAIALRATGESVNREARVIETFEDRDAYARSFAYVTGPALGLLLDRYASGWRQHASSASLESLLIAALHVSGGQDLAQQAEARAAAYGYTAVAAAERERDERHQEFLAVLTARFVNGRVLDFPSRPDMMRYFNPNTLVPFPPHGTYYPTGTFSANWGKLEVESGGALLSPDNHSVRVSAPAKPDARPLRGEGWVLELAPGWTVRPAQNAGSFVVVEASAP